MSVTLTALPAAAPARRRLVPVRLLRRLMVPGAIIALWYALTVHGYFDAQTMPTPYAVAVSFW